MLKVNVLGTLAVTQAMLPLIRKGGKKVVRSHMPATQPVSSMMVKTVKTIQDFRADVADCTGCVDCVNPPRAEYI